MQPSFKSSPTGHAWFAFLLVLFMGPSASAADFSIQTSGSARQLAFARYTTSYAERDAFANSGPIGVFIEASLPHLYKSVTLTAVRTCGENQPYQLRIVQIVGDGTAAGEVIDRYLALRQQIDLLPLSSVAITPTNYKFHFAGEVRTGGADAYIYDITPKKNRLGLVLGQLWMDSTTGNELILSGSMTDPTSTSGHIEFVRDTKLVNGTVYSRVTHVTLMIPLLGRAEVSVTEVPLLAELIPDRQ
jgi:hypothetical protein